MNNKNIDDYRKEIDRIDEQMVRLLGDRLEIVSKLVEDKIENNLPIFDSSREESILNRIMEKAQGNKFAPYIRDSYIGIMTTSKEMQQDIADERAESDVNSNSELFKEVQDGRACENGDFTVVYQGVPGSYGEEAMMQYFSNSKWNDSESAPSETHMSGNKMRSVSVKAFEDVFRTLEKGEADYGVLPVENSSTGSVAETMDLLAKYGFYITGEIELPISHNLLGVKGAKIEDVKQVFSHQQGFLQCSDFLEKYPHWLQVTLMNTAESAKRVADSNEMSLASISSKRAAEIYGLDVLAEGINGRKMNSTRFVVISKRLEVGQDADKISVMFTLSHKSGTLYHAIKTFADRGLNLMKIESRPWKDKNWEYLFFLDFEGNIREKGSQRAIGELKKGAGFFKLLGNY